MWVPTEESDNDRESEVKPRDPESLASTALKLRGSKHQPQLRGIRDEDTTAVQCDRTSTPAVTTASGEQIPGEMFTL